MTPLPNPRSPARLPTAFAAACLLFALPAATPTRAHATAAAATAATPGIAWIEAGTDAEVDRALARAAAERKPTLLYWGASWCPPCNQLKATLFNRQDFIQRTRDVVAVHVDGDLPGAQKLGARFKVRGYPTMILFDARGQELTRLPGEVEPAQVLALVEQGLAGGRSTKAILADARAGKALGAGEWKALAYYGWDTDEAQLVPPAERAGLLAQLAAQAPAAEAQAATRLWLKALAESDDGKGLKPDAALRRRVLALLDDAAASRAQMDMIVNAAPEITLALAPAEMAKSPERAALVQAFDRVLERLRTDATLSRGDRLSALVSQLKLARLDTPKSQLKPVLPAALVDKVRAHVDDDDRAIKDPHERQAVITGGAYALALAGLHAPAEALLERNLARSPAPYYLMSQLADLAKKQGRTADALRWSERAWTDSKGPATRLQWGASHLGMLVELAPQDAARIERTAQQVFDEAARDPAAFHERSARSLKRIGDRLKAWAQGGAHAANLARLQTRLQGVCAKVDAADGQKAACDAVLGAPARG